MIEYCHYITIFVSMQEENVFFFDLLQKQNKILYKMFLFSLHMKNSVIYCNQRKLYDIKGDCYGKIKSNFNRCRR